jgi:exosome complex protein LRP1
MASGGSSSSGSTAMLPAELATSVSEFETALAKVETLVGTLQGQPWAQICGPDTPPLDSARLHLMIAYAANSLFWIYLRTQGAKVQNHPVKAELERIKVALRKVKEAETSAAAANSTDENADAAKQPANANAAVAHRFVTAALGISQSKAGGNDAETDDASPAGASGGASGGKRKEKKSMDSGGSGGKKRKTKK